MISVSCRRACGIIIYNDVDNAETEGESRGIVSDTYRLYRSSRNVQKSETEQSNKTKEKGKGIYKYSHRASVSQFAVF